MGDEPTKEDFQRLGMFMIGDKPTREEAETFLQAHAPNTIVRAGDHITEIDHRPGVTICDFCNATPAPNVYECDDIVISEDNVLGKYVSKGGWGACGTCAAMIDSNDRKALLARGLKSAMKRAPKGTPVEIMRMFVEQSHSAFFAARKR